VDSLNLLRRTKNSGVEAAVPGLMIDWASKTIEFRTVLGGVICDLQDPFVVK
jgi:hypothetical protein